MVQLSTLMLAFLRVNLELWQKADLTILRAAVFIDRQHTERSGVGTVSTHSYGNMAKHTLHFSLGIHIHLLFIHFCYSSIYLKKKSQFSYCIIKPKYVNTCHFSVCFWERWDLTKVRKTHFFLRPASYILWLKCSWLCLFLLVVMFCLKTS